MGDIDAEGADHSAGDVDQGGCRHRCGVEQQLGQRRDGPHRGTVGEPALSSDFVRGEAMPSSATT